MDLIIANDLKQDGAGFRTDTNIITIIDRTGKSESFGKMTKIEAAGEILNRVKKIINRKSRGRKINWRIFFEFGRNELQKNYLRRLKRSRDRW